MPDKAPSVYGADILGGPTFNLSDYKGSFVVIAFMGLPWCGPCKIELPHLAALAQEYAADPSVPQVHFVIVNYKDQFGNDGIIAHAKEENITIPIIDDAKGAIMQSYGVTFVPQTYIVTPPGDLCDHSIGMSSAETLLFLLQKCGAPLPGSGITYDLKSQPPPVVMVNPSFNGGIPKDFPVPIPIPDPKPLSLMSRQVLRALALHDMAQGMAPHDTKTQIRSAALATASAGIKRMQSLADLERAAGSSPRAMPLPGRVRRADG